MSIFLHKNNKFFRSYYAGKSFATGSAIHRHPAVDALFYAWENLGAPGNEALAVVDLSLASNGTLAIIRQQGLHHFSYAGQDLFQLIAANFADYYARYLELCWVAFDEAIRQGGYWEPGMRGCPPSIWIPLPRKTDQKWLTLFIKVVDTGEPGPVRFMAVFIRETGFKFPNENYPVVKMGKTGRASDSMQQKVRNRLKGEAFTCLSEREQELFNLYLLDKQMTMKEAAKKMNVGRATVRYFIDNIKSKAGPFLDPIQGEDFPTAVHLLRCLSLA